MRAADTLSLLKDAYKGWSSDQASRLAAALAFYTIFAIAPLLIIIIEIAADILGGGGTSSHRARSNPAATPAGDW